MGGPLLDAPYWYVHHLDCPHSFLLSLSPCIALYCYFEGCFSAPSAFAKAWTPQTPCKTFWNGNQKISSYTTTILGTLFQISNPLQWLERHLIHWIPIIHTSHLSRACLHSLASVWIGLCTLFFSAMKLAVTTLWIKWCPRQATPIEDCCWTLSSYLQHNCWQWREMRHSK